MTRAAPISRGGVALVAACVLSSAGCRVLVELVESDPGGDAVDASHTDGGDRVDANVDCAWSYTPKHVDPCAIPAPGAELVLGPGTWSYDTNSGALTDPEFDARFPTSALIAQSDGPELRVLSVSSVDIQDGAVLRATGKRPLVIVSWSDLSVAGTIDVGSGRHREGAGGDPATCPDIGPMSGASSGEGAGGGGGGGFGSVGGAGGTGDGEVTAAGEGGAAVAMPEVVRGGCPGGIGGNSLAGPGGNGGGALYLVARDGVTIDGVLDAGGGGGSGSSGDRSGGSGGGSGGMIELQAPTVALTASAVLAANGGGGGGGSDGGIAIAGQDGQDDAVAAEGGDGQGQGAAGGAGGFADTDAEPGTAANRGGGGGGGGRGFIVVRATNFDDDGAVVSPPAVRPL